ncbi:hypothetical protein ACIHJG_34340 [Streptomyces sp. NPDC052415]|uniref:hypothetical protein n=1 Tax=Streptomyces sp. NPDC052415 TaxID=3365690 RepID=UPI0037D82687
MTDEPAKTPIQDKYAQQWANDLEAVRAKQAELAQVLEQLQADERWLLQQLDGVPGSATDTDNVVVNEELPASAKNQHTATAETTTSVPQPRQDAPAKAASRPAAKKRATAKGKPAATKAAAAKEAPAKKTAAKSPARRSAAKKTAASAAPVAKIASTKAGTMAGPPLHELVLNLLLKTPGEPRVASEITDQLAQEHPDRATSVQTVRNNLENLTKKGRAEKSKQQGNVMYTAYAAAVPAAATPADGASEQAPETAAETVPAEV